MNQVTFIFVNRNGANLWDAIHNVQSLYSDYTQDIIVVEQADALPFLRGQLFNIGVRYATGEYIALSDNDMFHLNKVPWIDIYDKVRCPLIGFKYISQVTLNNGRPTITSINECPTGFGGFNFMKKTDFISFNGFSNLFVGWGFEDNAYSKRFKYLRIPNNLGHITHPIRNYIYSKNREYNMHLLNTVNARNSILDGYHQTRYNVVSDNTLNGNVRVIKVNHITVCDNFKYIDELNHHYKLFTP